MTMLQFVEHALNRFVVVGEGIANAGWQPRIFDEILKAFAGQVQMSGTGVVVRFSLFLVPDPGPSWQPV